MKLTNPNQDRAIMACIDTSEPATSPGLTPTTPDSMEWFEIPAGESTDVEDYGIASTLVEYGAVPDDRAEYDAARASWAERNRTINSRHASAAASEGEILSRQQETVDVATGTTSSPGGQVDTSTELKGQALADAVARANDAGAGISSSLSAGEKREALTAWEAQRGASSPLDADEYETDEKGELRLDDDENPIPKQSDQDTPPSA